MSLGVPSLRIDETNARHHIWLNNGTWWVHYTLHFGHRKRRVRRSLGTGELAEAVRRRDDLLGRIAIEGEIVADRSHPPTPRSLHA